jgi:DNA-binding NarL/FixJ family response regulator
MSVDEKRRRGARAILITADVAAGEALAFACAQRGIEVIVGDMGDAETSGAECVVVDLRSYDAIARASLAGVRSSGVLRVIAIGSELGDNLELNFDVRIGVDACIEELIAALAGTTRTISGSGAEAMSDLGRLTRREREVMAHLLAGLAVESMGGSLGISANTVRTHLQNILVKLGVNSRTEAAAWALRAGLRPAELAAESDE